MRVRNIDGGNGPVRNQFIIYNDDNGSEIFQSYRSIIAIREANGKITLDRERWDYSKTTGRYRNIFLGEGIADTRRKIASGEYALANLN